MCTKCQEQLQNSKNRTDKNVQCADKNRMVLICPPCQHDTCQTGLEHLDGRRHDDRRWQVIPYPDGYWKEAMSEGIDVPCGNAEPTTMPSRTLCVRNEVDWCRYRDMTMGYLVHHDGSRLCPPLFQGTPPKLLHHYGWASSGSARCGSSLWVSSAPAIRKRKFLNRYL